MKKRGRIILRVIFALLIIAAIGTTWFIGSMTADGSRHVSTREQTSLYVPREGNEADKVIKKYNPQKVTLTSQKEGHTIPVDIMMPSKDKFPHNKGTVILVHGLGGNRFTVYNYGEMFLDLGYAVMMYDQRGAYENTSDTNTMGYLEKYDLLQVLSLAEEKNPGKPIGMWGTSYGAMTIGLALAEDNNSGRIKFAVLDSPVGNFMEIMRQEIASMDTGIPTDYLIFSGNLVNRIKFGFSYEDINMPVKLKEKGIKVPVLIMNSLEDTFTPDKMSMDIFNSLPEGAKEKHTFKTGKHAMLLSAHGDEYKSKIKEFTEKYGK